MLSKPSGSSASTPWPFACCACWPRRLASTCAAARPTLCAPAGLRGHGAARIFDNDGNYDDILAFLYLVRSPRFSLQAVTLEATGMATPHGGPPNLAALGRLLGVKAPVAYGEAPSLSPVATMPLQWRIELDAFFEKMYLQKVLEPLFSRRRPGFGSSAG